ncbi:hypothetical protein ALC53_09074 [Atta colombica]|uniref:Uncharacterized protein n=1 Tax=Atta colombica TaxID=520822 RepID=A0A195B8K4_9HYME|nr:hypothetical protein ALC53_09074 [Atta colombica]
MDFELVRFCQTRLCQPLAYILSLVPLQLQHLPVLRVLYYCPIAGKLLVLPNRPMVGEQRRGTEGSRNDGDEGKRKDQRRGSSPQC